MQVRSAPNEDTAPFGKVGGLEAPMKMILPERGLVAMLVKNIFNHASRGDACAASQVMQHNGGTAQP